MQCISKNVSFLAKSTFLLLVVFTLTSVLGELSAQDRRVHTVRQGETLYSISRQYEVTVDQIRTWNNLANNQINVGQRLYVSGASGTVTPRPQSREEANTGRAPQINGESGTDTQVIRHRVTSGETLFSLSRRYGVTVENIRDWNNLRSNVIELGQLLTIHVRSGRDIVEESATATSTSISREESQPVVAQPSAPRTSSDSIESGNVAPVAGAAGAVTVPQSGSAYYTVRAGDSLIRIANDHGISVADLMALNRLQSDRLTVGQVLLVRRPQGLPSVASGTTSSSPQGQFTSYQIARGERLNDILRKFEMTETELANLNPDIDIGNLRQGQQISVLLPPNITHKNPYRVASVQNETSEQVAVTRYNDLDRGRSLSNGDLYNPLSYTAAHSRLPLGSVVYVENPSNGSGLFVLINDRMVDSGIKLSHSAFEKLGFNVSSGNSATIRSQRE